jgi:hypothetical protein
MRPAECELLRREAAAREYPGFKISTAKFIAAK